MQVLRLAAGLLPFAAWFLISYLAAAYSRDWRRGVAWGTVGFGLVVAFGTEALSLIGQISPVGLLSFYSAVFIAIGWMFRRLDVSRLKLPRHVLSDWWVRWGIGVILLTLLVAVVAPPNNWDSMTYHMARVAHWAAQGDVSHYASHVERQLFLQPWAEFGILHTYVLSDGDRWANLIQWSAMCVSVVLVTLIGRNVGLSRRGQLVAGAIALTLPMGLTQAATTQNDYVAAMWVVLLAALVTDPEWINQPTVWRALAVGSAAGLAGATKATTYFFIAPLIVWILLSWLRRSRRHMALAVTYMALPALLLLAPSTLRNIELYDRPLGPPLSEFVNQPVGPRAAAENLYRHAALQLGVPSDAVNAATTRVVHRVAAAVGLGIERPESSFPDGTTFRITFGHREDDAQATAASALLVLSSLLLVWRRRALRGRVAPILALAGCATAGLLITEAYFQWNPWNARFLMPFFLLTAVVSGLAFDVVARSWSRIALVGLLGSCLVWVVASDLRPLVGSDSVVRVAREAQYFAARPELRESYFEATDFVRSLQVDRVGYFGREDDWEYPLWVLLGRGERSTSLQSVGVSNPSRRFEQPMPDVVICVSTCAKPSPQPWQQWQFGDVTVWQRRAG